jgi:predicted transcriptional regulator of viral defense system
VRVTSLERTLVDVLDRPHLAGTWEEIWRSLESMAYLDLDQVVAYTLLLGNGTTTAKVGFFLEQHREVFMVKEAHLQPLRQHRPRMPHYVERRDGRSGRLAPAWNVIVPREVSERSWQDVL